MRHQPTFVPHPLHVAVLLALAAPAAWPQSAPPANADDINQSVVTISAQRRVEELQKTPLALTAISSKELEIKQIRRLDDLKVEVPNVIIEQNTSTSSGAKIFMRGVGTDESLFTADPSVAIYIDDMYIARQTGAMFDMFDLQRVEVLRGPQGTLYGRNATGGAVRYITKVPTGEPRMEIDARLGNLGRMDFNLSGGARVGEAVGVSFGLMSKSRDGYLHDITNNRDVNTEHVLGARAAVAFALTSTTSARVSLDTLHQTSGPQFPSGILDPDKAAIFKRPVTNADNNLLTVETNLLFGKNSLDQSGLSLSTATDMGSFEWRNIVTVRTMDNVLFVDLDGTTATRFHLFQDQSQKQGSYESQFVSQGKGPLTWTGGLFAFKEKNSQPTRQDIFATGGINTIAQDTTATALYGQGDYRFGSIWKATAGARYSHETKDFSIAAKRVDGSTNFDFKAKNSWNRTDWKLGVDAQFTPDLLAYGSATTGFKSGGFNGRAGSVAAATLILKPETVLTYELGFKSTLAGGLVKFNANVFQNDYKDLQLTAFNSSGASVLTNAASAKIKGLEIDSSVQFTKAWQASLNVGTLDAKYKDFSAANAGIFDGKKLKQAPKLQYGASTSFRAGLGNGALLLTGQLKFVDDHYQNLANSELIKTSAYTIVDARAAYEAAGGMWSAALWGRNLTDRRYYTGGFDLSALGVAVAYLNVPRTYGVDLRYRFW